MGGVQVQCENGLQRGGLSVPQLFFAACSITLCGMVAFKTFALGGIPALLAFLACAILPACLVPYWCWLLWKILRTVASLLIKAVRALGNFLRKYVGGALVVSALSSIIALLHTGTGSEESPDDLVPVNVDTLSTSSDPWRESGPLNGEGWREGGGDNNNGRGRGSSVAMANATDVVAAVADVVGLFDVTGVGSLVVEGIRGAGSLVRRGEGDDETAEPENLATQLGKGCGYAAAGAFAVGLGDPTGTAIVFGCGLKVGQWVCKSVGKVMG